MRRIAHTRLALGTALFTAVAAAGAGWPTLRGNVERTGYVDAEIKPPFRLAWCRYFTGERIGSAVEPIVAEGKVFVGTHSGNLYALDAATGRPLWRVSAPAPLLHSPMYADGKVFAGDATQSLFAVSAETGKHVGALVSGGYSASPLVVKGGAFYATRGRGLGVCDVGGRPNVGHRGMAWFAIDARQTPASAGGRVFITGADLRVHCIDVERPTADPTALKPTWSSEPLVGQTARDYYPVIAKAGDRTVVIVRTNPVIQMSRLIGMDRNVLCANAGLKDSGWRTVDAWCKSQEAMGTPELWEKEQQAILKHLEEHKEARTFFVLDAETGKLLPHPPVLWIAGCQGVATPPVVMPDGRLLVFYRSAYGNWTHGVAPLVALGFLDLTTNRIEPLTHAHGMRPPWNTFWGTADESQNFVVARDTVLCVHQGTLSGFDLKTRKLFLIWGNRDTWGGFKNLPWARNEWHGPARGGVAVVGNRIYWQTGSRVLCIVCGEGGKPAADVGVEGAQVPTRRVLRPRAVEERTLLHRMSGQLAKLQRGPWAPLCVQPGLAGPEFLFDNSAELFEAVAWAFPHIAREERYRQDLRSEKAKALLAKEWEVHPLFTRQAWYALDQGRRREPFWVPPDALRRRHGDEPHHPFGNVYAAWLYAERCGEWGRVKAAWPQTEACFEDFAKTGWKLDPAKGDLHANRYLASLIAFARIAGKAGDAEAAAKAKAMADRTAEALVAWWQRSAEQAKLPVFEGIRQWDSFIGKGDALFFKVRGHNSKIALFRDLTPEVAALVKAKAPDAVESVWHTFEALCPTWYLVGEERQVHFGENFVDPPDFALDAFKAYAWLRGASKKELARRVDIAFCKADLAFLTKLAIALEE